MSQRKKEKMFPARQAGEVVPAGGCGHDFARSADRGAGHGGTRAREAAQFHRRVQADRREKTDPVRVRENSDFLTLERIKKCPKECV